MIGTTGFSATRAEFDLIERGYPLSHLVLTHFLRSTGTHLIGKCSGEVGKRASSL